MSRAAKILAGAQRFHRSLYPARIKIKDQCYDASTSGLNREMTLAEGPSEIRRIVSFWLPLKSFLDAGQPIPRELSHLHAADPGNPDKWIQYLIETVLIDGANVNVTLNCVQHTQ